MSDSDTRVNSSGYFSQSSSTSAEFLDIVGHELRTPVAVLRGNVQLLQRRLRKETGRDADLLPLAAMLYQIERLNHQLDIYLATVHIEQRRFVLTPAQNDLVSMTRRIAAIYAASQSGHAIHIETTLDELPGTWDVRRIELAIAELLANAIKYSQAGDILIAIDRTGDTARLEVSDRGIGVPVKDRLLIFQPRTHGSNVENAGAGLGLYVAREVIQRQGGKIGVRARPGGGSTFWFTIPVQAVMSNKPAIPASHTTIRRRRKSAATVPEDSEKRSVHHATSRVQKQTNTGGSATAH